MPLDSNGFTPKSLQDIRDAISDNLKLALGNDIDTSASSRIGQFIDVVSNEIFSAWQGMQDVYNSFYPDTASGTSLDGVVSITNTQRLDPTATTADVYLAGDDGTVIASGSTIQKTDTDKNFNTQDDHTIPDTSNLVVLDMVADAGTITLEWDGEAVAPIDFDESLPNIKSIIEGHSKITDVTVLGGLDTIGYLHIKFNADTLTSREATVNDSDLTRDSEDISVEPYFSTDDPVQVLCTEEGEIAAPQTSLTTIVSNVTGWDAVVNFESGTLGRSYEEDGELRERRDIELQKSGTTTNGGIREEVLGVQFVTNVTIIENDTSIVDIDGREPHSYEVYVTGGDDDEVAQAIYDTKPAGINVVTTVPAPNQRVGNIIDVNGEAKTLTFSEPVDVPMEIEVNITVDANYPLDGDDQIKASLISYFEGFELGEDVLNHLLYSPVNTVPGIVTLEILQDTVAGGVPSAGNTVISTEEVATLEPGDITVTIS